MTFIAVGTPFDGERDRPHRTSGRGAAEIGAALRDNATDHVVVVKSTVVPGTTDARGRARRWREASGKRAGADFGVGMNPEFLTEGQAVHDFMEPDRIVAGRARRSAIAERVLELYAPLPERAAPAHQHGRPRR